MSSDWRAKVDEFRLRQQEQRERHPLGWLLNGCAAVAILAALAVLFVVAGVLA